MCDLQILLGLAYILPLLKPMPMVSWMLLGLCIPNVSYMQIVKHLSQNALL